MSAMSRLVLLLAALGTATPALAAPGAPSAAVQVANGRVSVRFADTPLEAAVEQLAASVGARVEWRGTVDKTAVSTDLADVPFTEALERVLHPRSFFVVTAGQTSMIRRVVVLLGACDAHGALPVPPAVPHPRAEPRAFPNPGGLDSPVMMLLEDPDPTVRRSMLDHVRALDQGDPRRDVVLSRLLSDPDEQLRDDALQLHGGFVPP